MNVAQDDVRVGFCEANGEHVVLKLKLVFKIHLAVDVAADCVFHFDWRLSFRIG